MTSSRKFERLLQAGCLGLIGMLTAAGCGGSSSPSKGDTGIPDGSTVGEVQPAGGAILTLSQASVDLGTIDVGVKSAPVTVTVKNVGTASGPLTVTVLGTGISATGCSGAPLAAQATCQLSITAQAAVAGAISGTIEVGDTAANTKKIAVSGLAVPPGQFSLSTNALDLGVVITGKSASGTVVMTNASSAGLSDVVIAVSGTGFSDAKTGTCTAVLPVGQTCTINVGFTAGSVSGAAKGSLTVSQGGVTRTVALSATVQAPAKLVMTPASASLQTVVGTPSSPVTFYVTNAGDVTSAIPTVAITGTNKDDFSFTSTCATAIVGGATASCQVTVVYNPKAAPTTNSTATLTVAESVTGGSSISAVLTGSAVPPSDLVISGAATNFGEVVVGSTSAPLTFTLTNAGGDDSGLVKVSGAGPFSVVSDNCSDKTLAAKATCTFTAQFKPAAGDMGVVQGQLKATGANVANPAFFGVTGTAVPQAKLAIKPNSLEFSAIPTLQESPAQVLTISNAGGAPTGALKVENTGAQFNVKADTCTGAVLTAAGATSTCTVTVTFTPTGTTVDATGSIVVSDITGAAGTISATLHGTSTARPAVAFNPRTVCPESGDPSCTNTTNVFQDKVVGRTSTAVTFTVTNTTAPSVAADSGTLSFAFSGDAASDFAIVQNNCTAPLVSVSAPTGTSCVLTVSFTPSAVGLRNAFLTLTTSRGAVDRATLVGKGLAVIELEPRDDDADATPPVTGLDHGSTPLGTTATGSLEYRVWVRDTSATDGTTTVTVALPTPSLQDFVFVGGTNPCTNKTLNLNVPSTTTTQNGYDRDGSTSNWYCDFDVLFAPKSAKGALTANLSASATGGGSASLALTGTATGPLVVGVGALLTKPAIIETPVAVGTTSSITLTIKNKGLVDQKGLTFALSGTGASDFQIVNTTCWGDTVEAIGSPEFLAAYDELYAVTLEPNDSCTVTVGFAPQTETKYSITFTATAANGAGAADDESDSVAIITSGLSTLGTLTVTPNPATTQFGDVAEGSTTATPVTFTVTNTGTLPAKNLRVAALSGFQVLPSVGVAGACTLDDTAFTLAGNTPCTIRVRPTPTSSHYPNGTQKSVVSADMSVKADFDGQDITVEVPLLYYVTSSIVVRDTGASSTSIAYAFPAAGVQTVQKRNFVVTNIGSSAATLVTDVEAPFAVETAPTGTLDPAACNFGASGLPAGASCTLVLQNLNTTVGLETGKLTINDSGKAGKAEVTLSATTLSDSKVAVQGLGSNTTINLGSVPADSTTISFVGGKATVWYKNEGAIATAALNFRWGTGVAGTADPEFIIDSDETSCVGKVLQPNATCSMNVHFKVDYAKVPSYDQRSRVLVVVDGSKASDAVTFEATATETASLYIEDITAPVKTGFYAFPGVTAVGGTSTARTFRIVNASSGDVTFTLPAANAQLAGPFFMAATQPTTGAGGCDRPQTLSTAKSSCTFNVDFRPDDISPLYQHTFFGVGAAEFGLMGKVQQPVTLTLTPATADFGTVAAGATAARSFTVTNTGDVAMATDKVSLSTSIASDGTAATYAITADACNATRLAAGASCVITVTATGVTYDADPQTGTLTVANADYLSSSLTSSLTVLAKHAATIAVSPTVHSFGQVPVTGYEDQTFSVSNLANAVVSGAVTASLSGKDAAQFSVLSSTCSTGIGLEGGGSCAVTVRFRPMALSSDGNDMVAVLTLTATPGGTKTVNLTGTPVAALTIDPVGPVDFAGSTALQVFTVTLGDTATATSALKTSLVGADFMIVNDGCYAQILSDAKKTCEISVKYIGTTSPTKKTATLTVNGGSVAKTVSAVINATSAQAESH